MIILYMQDFAKKIKKEIVSVTSSGITLANNEWKDIMKVISPQKIEEF